MWIQNEKVKSRMKVSQSALKKPRKTQQQQQQQVAPLSTLQPASVASAIEDKRAGVELAIEKYEVRDSRSHADAKVETLNG